MHADGDWQAVEEMLSKDMATISEYLQTWKLKLSTTKTVTAAFHLNKEAKRELKVNLRNKPLPICSEPKYLRITLDRLLMYHWDLKPFYKKLTSCVSLLRWLAGPGWGAGATTLWIATLPWSIQQQSTALLCGAAVLIPALSSTTSSTTLCELWLDACILHQRTTFLSSQASNLLSLERSYSFSSTLCHWAWTPAPLSAHQPTRHKSTAPQIETPICARRTITHQFIQQQHTYKALRMGRSPMEDGVVGQPYVTPYFHPWHQHLPSQIDPPKNSVGPV